jgi:heme exporter protein A
MSLTIQRLGIGYDGFCLLPLLSFQLAARKFLTITGSNGIGKSTLLGTLAGLIPPLEGHIENRFSSLRFLSLCQPLERSFTVLENLRYWAAFLKGSTTEVEEALSYFKLTALKDEMCQHLSTGQQQRLYLANLFLNPPQLWLLDEPLRSLDEEGVTLFRGLIHQHLEKGGAVVMAQPRPFFIGEELNLNKWY